MSSGHWRGQRRGCRLRHGKFWGRRCPVVMGQGGSSERACRVPPGGAADRRTSRRRPARSWLARWWGWLGRFETRGRAAGRAGAGAAVCGRPPPSGHPRLALRALPRWVSPPHSGKWPPVKPAGCRCQAHLQTPWSYPDSSLHTWGPQLRQVDTSAGRHREDPSLGLCLPSEPRVPRVPAGCPAQSLTRLTWRVSLASPRPSGLALGASVLPSPAACLCPCWPGHPGL